MRYLVAAFLIVLSATTLAFMRHDAPATAAAVAGMASPDAAVVRTSIEELRRAGPEGLRAILKEHERHPDAVSGSDIDEVAGQHDAHWSRLYWYTDLDAAKAAARSEHKPILYLRMLGKLTDEYSCANSRFFRTVLYANSEVSSLLRDRFVLVWASERPVPVITIDYGDGRVLKRTITGNSAHYVLDSDGNVVDALPGLYDPVTFARILTAAARVGNSVESRREYWRQSKAALTAEWVRDTAGDAAAPSTTNSRTNPDAVEAINRAPSKAGPERPLVRAVLPPVTPNPANPAAPVKSAAPPIPNAAQAAERTMGKSMGETPMLRQISPEFAAALQVRDADEATWERIAARHAADARLDANSVALIRSQNPAGCSDSASFARLVTQFQRSIAADTVRNNYDFRRQILGWLTASTRPVALEALNQRVYSELFLTPRSDPWLGLVPESAYSALTNEGCGHR